MTRVKIGTALWGETSIDLLALYSLWQAAKQGYARATVVVQIYDTSARKVRVYAMDVQKIHPDTFTGLVHDDAVPSNPGGT